MKKILFLFIALTIVSCNDGDFDVPEFEFTDIVYGCGNTNGGILYLKSTAATETMAITLIDGELGTEEGTEEFSISSSLQVVYRLMDDSITEAYYCQVIPPILPVVVKELNAEDTGVVQITTSKVLTDGVVTGYKYEIIIKNLVLLGGGDRISIETFYFGDSFQYNIDS